MADQDNRRNDALNEDRLPSDENRLPGADTAGTEDGAVLADDDLLGDDEIDTEDADLAEADLFDDDEDLVSLDEIEDDEAEDVTGQDDDNPYQESDEALPDDDEERSIARDNSREGSRFGEV
ncbi:hypothetical protein ACFOEZ_12600 [Tianweitania populi]|uniref:Uncharacterized protein n=1 Tax=Tianweitania populi TaxID=1607949 RepID=A0A8J3DRP2_9HYPH|nr:hypothetical protein [Tianweitania populi]GHD19846.1 hypothetical protein GCM10016234_31990 [Tianweitania populi]